MPLLTGAELQAERAAGILRDLRRAGKAVTPESAMDEVEATLAGALPYVEKEALVHAVLELHVTETRASKANENQEGTVAKKKAAVLTKEDAIALGAEIWRENPKATVRAVYDQLEEEHGLPMTYKSWAGHFAPVARRRAKGEEVAKSAAAPPPRPKRTGQPPTLEQPIEPERPGEATEAEAGASPAEPAEAPATPSPFTPVATPAAELFARLFGGGDRVEISIGRQTVEATRTDDGVWSLSFRGLVSDAELDGFMQHVWTVGRAS